MYVGAQETAFEQVEAALSGQPGAYLVHWVRSADAAPMQPVDPAPDIILLGEDLSGADGLHLIRRLLMRWPRAVILVMVSVKTMAGASRAVMAGARGFVALPLQRDDLLATIDLALMRDSSGADVPARGAPGGRVVVFCAPRGGTGRTTLAANTAVALRALGEKGVALVDADFGSPAVDVALNLQGRYQIADLLAHSPNLDHDLVEQVLTEHTSGVQALLAPVPSEAFEPPSPADVQEIVGQLKRDHAWVLVDLGLPLDDLAFSFLDVADRIVVNVVPEMVALRNTRCMMESMQSRGYAQERLWLVASRSPSEGAISKADMEARLRIPVVYQIPDDNALVMFCLNRGVPAVTSHPRSALARAIRSFAQALVADAGRGDAGLSPSASAEHGWLGRLLGRAEAKTQEAPRDGARSSLSADAAKPAGTQPARLDRLDLSESLLLEACPCLGLPGEPTARFPYPCTANYCCSTTNPVPVDPAYQSETCFGSKWAPCPRFMERLAIEDGAAPEPDGDDGRGFVETVIHSGAGASSDGQEDLSGSFVLQSCPYLGLADDDTTRYPYPDGANCCHARDLVRAVAPEYQAKACFAGDWASCPQFKAGLSDSFFLDASTDATDEEPAESDAAVTAPAEVVAVPEGQAESAPGAIAWVAPVAEPEADVPAMPAVAVSADDDTHSPALPVEGCPFLGMRDDPTMRRSSPDMDHYCHAGDWPQPMQPSYQVNYCLSAHWPLCENWEQATKQPEPSRVVSAAGRDESSLLKRAKQRRSDVLGELDSLSALLRPQEAAPAAAPAAAKAVVPAPGEPTSTRDSASCERACPHLALREYPDRWISRPHPDNGCGVRGTLQPVADVYQAATCFSAYWRECPRLKAAEGQQESAARPAPPPQPVVAAPVATPAATIAASAAPAPSVAPAPTRSAAAPLRTVQAPAPCPYLGLVDDEETCRPVPHEDNHCHTGPSARAVEAGHQERVCLSGDWQSCPRFLATIDGALLGGSAAAHPAARPERQRMPRWVRTLLKTVLGVVLLAVALLLLRPWAQAPEWLAHVFG